MLVFSIAAIIFFVGLWVSAPERKERHEANAAAQQTIERWAATTHPADLHTLEPVDLAGRTVLEALSWERPYPGSKRAYDEAATARAEGRYYPSI